MGLNNVLLLSQCGGYSVAVILSLTVAIPMVMHSCHFKGHCLLFSVGKFVEADGRFEPDWASFAYCAFIMSIAFLSCLISLVQLVRMSIFLKKSIDNSFLSAFWDTIISLFMALATITNAILVTRGFAAWCAAVTARFPSCETANVMQIGKDSGIDASSFFIEIGTVQFAIWTLFVCWILLLVLAGRKLFIYHERENIIISMARERKRYSTLPD